MVSLRVVSMFPKVLKVQHSYGVDGTWMLQDVRKIIEILARTAESPHPSLTLN